MTLLIIGIMVFLGVHSFSMMRGWREALIARLGSENAFKGIYSLLALAGLVLIVMGFGHYRAAGMSAVFTPPVWGRHIAMLLMLVAFIFFAATYIPSRIRSAVQHPMITAVMLWAFAHLLANGDLGSLVLFGGFLLWGILARLSMGRRTRTIFAASPQIPPLSIRNDIVIVVMGTLLYAATLIWLHPLLIGVPVVAL
nr:MAG: NnrU family protein [Hyphomicrobiales bacterium]